MPTIWKFDQDFYISHGRLPNIIFLVSTFLRHMDRHPHYQTSHKDLIVSTGPLAPPHVSARRKQADGFQSCGQPVSQEGAESPRRRN